MLPLSIDTFIPGIMLCAVMQGVILIVMLLKLRKGNRFGHRILAWLIFFFVSHLVSELFDKFGYFIHDSGSDALFDMLLLSVGLTIAPLIFLYTDVMTQRHEKKFRWTFWVQFLPAIFFLLYSAFLMLDNQPIQTTEDMPLSHVDLLGLFGFLLLLFQGFIYLALSFMKLSQHNKTIKIFFSATERINLNWLRNILIGFILLFSISLSQFFIEPFAFEKQIDDILTLSMVTLIYLLGYMGMQQADIFRKEEALTLDFSATPPLLVTEQVPVYTEKSANPLEEREAPELKKERIGDIVTSSEVNETQTDAPKQKYQKSALDKEASKLLFDDLLKFMEEKKPYLDNSISLSELARQVQLSPNYLSQIINEQSQNNFFDFINRYRISHFKLLLAAQLKDNKSNNMIETALDSGFNSKSAFYKAFKKYESMTPSQYRKSIQTQSDIN